MNEKKLNQQNDRLNSEIKGLQEDQATTVNHNNCWSDMIFFNREINYTTIHNDSSEVYLPFLLNQYDKRLILPSSSFVLELEVIENHQSTIRFANLKGSYINVNLYDLGLSSGDKVIIEYKYGDFLVYNNKTLITEFKFTIEDYRGYVTWRLPSGASVKYRNFKLYVNESSFEEMVQDNIFLKNENYELIQKLNLLEQRFNSFEETTIEKLDSANFLFNNLYLDYELKPKKLLKEMQGLCTEFLAFIDNICKKHNLHWWLDYGNLLGAVRHKNFIPWDDDVDIGMMRNDYDKLNNVLQDEINAYSLNDLLNVSYRKREIGDCKVNGFIQIFITHRTKNNQNTIFAGIDIFPYDFLVKYDKNNIEKIYLNSKNEFYKSLTNGNDSNKLYMGLNSDIVLKEYYNNLNLDMNKTKFIIPGVEGSCGPNNLYKLMVINYDTLFPLKTIEYNEKIFPCPNNSNEYLKSIYGDYMKVPHIIRTHDRINLFRYDSEIYEIFKKDYERLKNINIDFNK